MVPGVASRRAHAMDGRAVHVALVAFVIERRRAVLGTAVVPQDGVADAPLVGVDGVGPGRLGEQVVEQAAAGHAGP